MPDECEMNLTHYMLSLQKNAEHSMQTIEKIIGTFAAEKDPTWNVLKGVALGAKLISSYSDSFPEGDEH